MCFKTDKFIKVENAKDGDHEDCVVTVVAAE